MLTSGELAARPDYAIGPATVSPATRTIRGPGGEAALEPRVAQLLTVLADAEGAVVTRDTLFARCWGTAQVADDSLNRAVATARKVLAQVAGKAVEIETIPRTGYRLVAEGTLSSGEGGAAAGKGGVTRRAAAAGTLAVAGAAGLGWWALGSRADHAFDQHIERGVQALSYGDPEVSAIPHLERAVALRPDDARARGLLAYAHMLGAGDVGKQGDTLLAADRAVRAALALDPNQPDARVAQTMLDRHRLDFAATEDRLRAVLAFDPDNIRAMQELWRFLTCVGRCREALSWVERALAVAPLAAANNYPRAQLLWIIGWTAEADRVIDRAHDHWPAQRGVRFARFILFAFTGRARAAMALLDDPATRPKVYSTDAVALWRISLRALDQRTPATIAAAVNANVEGARRKLGLTSQAVMTLSALGELDAAFDLMNALFVVPGRRGPADGRDRAKSTAWRFAPWLFTPPIAAMRADPRFKAICDTIGLTEYWARRGVRPDFPIAGL